ncbi:MAG: HAMP domain-containing histidine kinase [Kofleriaceae bacterium]|nr:MAG: HAMP domain-containing histidine kinase [Kofleriaceae bacterium]
MLDFLTQNRVEIVERCRLRVAGRRAPKATGHELERGIPLFLDQLIETLRLRLASNPDLAGAATQHGGNLMSEGFTVAQVVHDYGDLCQAVADLAVERGAPIEPEDFRTLTRCLDDAIADAVTEFFRLHEIDRTTEDRERQGIFAHELRNLLNSASLAFDVLKSGRVGANGATGGVLERSLTGLRSLIERSLTEVRLEAGIVQRERIDVRRLLEEIEVTASLGANAKGVAFSVELPATNELAVEADPQLLSALVINLVQNAVKFTHPAGHVAVSARATPERVLLDVADECGGLPPGAAESLFRPFQQGGKDRSGLGLGLTIARRSVEASGGEIRVRDVPGTGCVFTVELPRAP